jgi:hypothetical protein
MNAVAVAAAREENNGEKSRELPAFLMSKQLPAKYFVLYIIVQQRFLFTNKTLNQATGQTFLNAVFGKKQYGHSSGG